MSQAIESDSGDVTNAVYHIVCHDCLTEFICRSESEAERRTSQHRTSTGHNVEYAALAAGGTETSVQVNSD